MAWDSSGIAINGTYWSGDGELAKWKYDGNITAVAQWNPLQINVTLDKQGGTGGTSTISPTYGSAMPAIVKPTKTGYIFGGYYTGTNGTGTQYYTADGASARAWDSTTITTLYAKWTEDIVTITFDSNDGGEGWQATTSRYTFRHVDNVSTNAVVSVTNGTPGAKYRFTIDTIELHLLDNVVSTAHRIGLSAVILNANGYTWDT